MTATRHIALVAAFELLERAARSSPGVDPGAIDMAAVLVQQLVDSECRRQMDLSEANAARAITDAEKLQGARRWIEFIQRRGPSATQRSCAGWWSRMDGIRERRARYVLEKILATPSAWPLSDPLPNTSDGAQSEHDDGAN